MNIEFEQKYFVVKIDDVNRYLSDEGKKALFRCMDSLSDSRRHDGKQENTYLVINTDEPYAGQVAQIMQKYGHFTPGGQIEVAAPEPEVRQEIRYTSAYSCPACDGGFTGTGIANYCYHCGQKLDWGWVWDEGENENDKDM